MTTSRDQLRTLADDCEARARRSTSGDARTLYHRAALDARRHTEARYIGEGGLRLALDAAASLMRFAAYMDGETIDVPPPRAAPEEPAGEGAKALQDAPSPRQGLNARQLARLAGMSERGALKRIVHAFDQRLPGFYRNGRRWFAERDAFDQFRMSSD